MEKEALSKSKLYRLLAELEASPEDYISLYVAAPSFPRYVNELSLGPKFDSCLNDIRETASQKAVIQQAQKWKTGAAIFWQANGNKRIVLPPFPITENRVSLGRLDSSLLRETLQTDYTIGVVLVAWGSYALGLFSGDKLVEHKIGSGHIHKEHKKGGSSQKRFARRTEEQRDDFLRRVANRIDERFQGRSANCIFFGGNRFILKPLSKECKYLQLESKRISGRVLEIRGHANMQALNHSLTDINTSLTFSM